MDTPFVGRCDSQMITCKFQKGMRYRLRAIVSATASLNHLLHNFILNILSVQVLCTNPPAFGMSPNPWEHFGERNRL